MPYYRISNAGTMTSSLDGLRETILKKFVITSENYTSLYYRQEQHYFSYVMHSPTLLSFLLICLYVKSNCYFCYGLTYQTQTWKYR